MSKKDVKSFFDEIEKNPELRTKFEAVLAETHEIVEDIIIQNVTAFAQNSGFRCSQEDFNSLTHESQELSDEDMQKVSGGYWRIYPPSWYYKEIYKNKK